MATARDDKLNVRIESATLAHLKELAYRARMNLTDYLLTKVVEPHLKRHPID